MARRRNHLYRSWGEDPPLDAKGLRRQTRIKEIDQWITHHIVDMEALTVTRMGADQSDPERTKLYSLELEKMENWLTTMKSLRQSTLDEEAKEEYPNLMTVMAEIMRPKDRVIVAQMERARKALREKEEKKKLWQKVMSEGSR